jgi:hypothetical protein
MQQVAPELVGPHDPLVATPTRRPSSVRRTTTIDSIRADALATSAVLDLRGRDLFTAADGSTTEIAVERAEVNVDSRTVTSISVDPAIEGLDDVVGSSVGNRFRARLATAAPALVEARPLLAQLLDDVVGTCLVNGYSLQRAGIFDKLPVKVEPSHVAKVADVCAGWATEATILRTVREVGEIPTPFGPAAPDIVTGDDDPLAWHATEPLVPHGMRRLRRLDVSALDDTELAGDRYGFDVHFRDSHVDEDGNETVLHEYTVTGSVDAGSRTVSRISATAKVLPWVECPGAIGSERRVLDRPVSSLRAMVLAELVGTTTCTHLNDTLRSLAGLDELMVQLTSRRRPTKAKPNRRPTTETSEDYRTR